MSVRIYQLSKQLNMENKQLIALLQERGFKVESPSNTVANIYADALLEEFGGKQPALEAKIEAKSDEQPITHSLDLPKKESPAKVQVPEAAPLTPTAAPVAKKSPAPAPLPPKPAISSNTPPAAPKLPPAAPRISTFQKTERPQNPQVTSSEAPLPKPAAPEAPSKPSVPPRPPVPQTKVNVIEAPATPSTSTAPKIPTFPQRAPLPPRPSTPIAATPLESTPKGPLKKVACKPPVIVRDLATILNIKPFRLISELMSRGVFASMNQVIDEEVAVAVALAHGITLEIRHRGETQAPHTSKKAEPTKPKGVLSTRPPVVCVLGHVDHGKTTLLDTIRRTHVVKGEAGGITQHIGAYQVEHNGQKITFIDTPGHAAFSKMRERGANVTDIAVLVVAADDGFMPQTDEALKFALKANVPVVAAINKIDAKGANIDRVKQQLQQRNLTPEDWGGETLVAPVSALKGDGMPGLLDSILLQAEIMELQADPKGDVEATIVEAQMEQGLGCTATVIINQGTLKPGDALTCGNVYCRVRSMMNDQGKPIKEAPPSTPVKIIGWSGVPEAGLVATGAKNEKEARAQAEAYHEDARRSQAPAKQPKGPADVAALFAALTDNKKVLKVIIKADVQGSAEALEGCLKAIKSEKVSLEVVDSTVGLISKNDINMASTTDAVIVAFNTKLDTGVAAHAKHNNTRIVQHNIIYELITQVQDCMIELLDPDFKEVKQGAAEVRQVFSLTKGVVAGCMVTEGRILRDCQARLIRKGKVIHEGKVVTLKRFKDDANEVKAGYECGIRLDGFNDYQPKDIVECFQLEKVPGVL